MAGYISESFRYYEIAKNNLINFQDNKCAFTCVLFSAMYVEGVINDIIFSDKLTDRVLAKYKNIEPDNNYDFDLYHDRTSFDSKLAAIFEKYSFDNYEGDKKYIELKHLISIRNSLVHLKPLEQNSKGKSIIRVSKKALNYLHNNLKIISSPFDSGVFWTDTLMNKEVAEWSINVAKQSVEYLYDVTFIPLNGNHQLDFHLKRLRIEKE
tara:strand:- start:8774 stop:9400 length:627 start_codon:yes stop_codon:yes gene_type:complete